MADINTVEGKASLFDKLLNNKALRRDVLKELSKESPDVYVPELAVGDELLTKTAELQKNIDAIKSEQDTRVLQDRLAAERRATQEKYRLNEADTAAVEKIMVEKKIADYGSAAEFMRLSQQAALPTPSAAESRTLKLPDKKGDWFKNPKQKAREEATAALNEIRSRNAA
ncbi:MAG: hypothetical protein ACYDCJ_12945 [Gammaproteobacteria bacterium]